MISFLYQYRFFFFFRKRYFYLSSSLSQNNADIYHVVLSSFTIKNKMLAKHQKYVLFFFYGDTFWRHCLIYHSQNSWFLKGYSCILHFSSFFHTMTELWYKVGKKWKTKKKTISRKSFVDGLLTILLRKLCMISNPNCHIHNAVTSINHASLRYFFFLFSFVEISIFHITKKKVFKKYEIHFCYELLFLDRIIFVCSCFQKCYWDTLNSIIKIACTGCN